MAARFDHNNTITFTGLSYREFCFGILSIDPFQDKAPAYKPWALIPDPETLELE